MQTPDLKIKAGELSKALAAVAPAKATRSDNRVWPASAAVHLWSDGSSLLNVAACKHSWDGVLAIETSVGTVNRVMLDVLAPTRLLTEFVGMAENEETIIGLKMMGDGSAACDLVIQIGETSVLRMKTFDPADHVPVPRQWATMDTIEWDAPALRGPAVFVAHAASHDDSRPVLTNICIQATPKAPGMLDIAATDSYRLAVLNVKGELPFKEDLLLPASCARLLPEEPSRITFGTPGGKRPLSWMGWKIGPTSYRLEVRSDMVFPGYHALIPASFRTKVVFDRDRLLRALRASAKFKAIAGDPVTPVKLEIGKPGVGFQTSIQDVGVLSDSMAVDVEGPDVDVAFNPEYMRQAVQAISSPSVTLEMIDGLKPCVLRSEGFMVLLMPVRVS